MKISKFGRWKKVKHRSAESEGLKFDSSWEFEFFLVPRSLTFDEPVGESEVESLLLDASNDGSLGNLKVESFSVGPTISGVYKLSTKFRVPLIKVGSVNCKFVLQMHYLRGGNSLNLHFWLSARLKIIFVIHLHIGCTPKTLLITRRKQTSAIF